MTATVLLCGRMFDGSSEELTGPTEVESGQERGLEVQLSGC